MRVPAKLHLALLTLLALSACDKPDVGSRCNLAWGSDSASRPTPATAKGDYFESGNSTCDDLICIVSPATTGRYSQCSGGGSSGDCGYCSKPCVSDRDCYSGSTDLVCAQVILDPLFIASLDPETAQRYLGETRFTSYCVVPRQ